VHPELDAAKQFGKKDNGTLGLIVRVDHHTHSIVVKYDPEQIRA
jgi:hypothetical protein